MFGFLNRNTNNNNMVMLTEADVKKLKHNHGVVLFFMNGCGHCVDMKDDWNAAVDECRNNGIGSDRDNFVLGAVESGNTDMFQKNGITTNVSGYPTILYITAESIKNGNTNYEKYENPREKKKFIEWITEKKNRKKSKAGLNKVGLDTSGMVKLVMNDNNNNINNNKNNNNKNNNNKNKNKKNQTGGGRKGSRRRTNRRKYTRKTKSRAKSRTRHRRHYMRGGDCGCGSGGITALFGK